MPLYLDRGAWRLFKRPRPARHGPPKSAIKREQFLQQCRLGIVEFERAVSGDTEVGGNIVGCEFERFADL
jgi:hypothetical protein